jgi:hypothetical protein
MCGVWTVEECYGNIMFKITTEIPFDIRRVVAHGVEWTIPLLNVIS